MRDTTGQLSLSIRGAAATISRPLVPREPISERIVESASGRADSVARCAAMRCAVSETSPMVQAASCVQCSIHPSLERAFGL